MDPGRVLWRELEILLRVNEKATSLLPALSNQVTCRNASTGIKTKNNNTITVSQKLRVWSNE